MFEIEEMKRKFNEFVNFEIKPLIEENEKIKRENTEMKELIKKIQKNQNSIKSENLILKAEVIDMREKIKHYIKDETPTKIQETVINDEDFYDDEQSFTLPKSVINHLTISFSNMLADTTQQQIELIINPKEFEQDE